MALWVPPALFAAAVLCAALASTAVVGVTAALPESEGALLAGQVALWIVLAGGSWLAARRWWTGRPSDSLGARVLARDVPVGLLAGLGLQLGALPGLYWLLDQAAGRSLDPGNATRELLDGGGPVYLVVVIVAAVAIAPVIEELFYRGLFLRTLSSRWGPAMAVAVTSVFFAAVHLNLVQFPGLLAAGIAFGSLAVWAGRLGPALVAHISFNATTVVAHLAFTH